MIPTTLIQRLRQPIHKLHESPRGLALASMSFGGGLPNGGLSDEAMKLLLPIFEFDYMGSSEFEHGAVPRTLQAMARMASDGGIELRKIDIELAKIEASPFKGDELQAGKTAPVYVVGSSKYAESLEDRTRVIVKKEGSSKPNNPVRLQDGFHLGRYLKYGSRFDQPVVAGLELNNHFLISADQEMANKLLALLTKGEA